MRALTFTTLVITFATAVAHLVGVGIGDITGPAADINFMGYAMPSQVSAGIHFRLYARAFVVKDSDDSTPIAFVSMDNGMGSSIVRVQVLDRLNKLFPNVFTEDNLSISGTHTHSAPAGTLPYVLFQITSLGFVHEAFEPLVNGIVEAVSQAYLTCKPGKMYVTSGHVDNANINRSPSAYLANPKAERERYDANTDKKMVMLKFVDADDKPLGQFNWYAVHGTSMPNTNSLISGDNKGYASLLHETKMNPGRLPGQRNSFVAAFCATNLGDVSPNTNGTFCSDTGKPCEELHSTCDGKNEKCHGRGPGQDMFDSTAIIGRRQFNVAEKLFNNADRAIEGPIKYIHANRFFHNITIRDSAAERAQQESGGLRVVPNDSPIARRTTDTGKKTTCRAGVGFAFAAGTTDGPGAFDFVQGDTHGTLFWDVVRDFLVTPSKELQACQHPKPVLLATGEVNKPYGWDPDILPLQLFTLGRQFCIISVPSEFTTMAGRRLRDHVKSVLVGNNVLDKDAEIVIAGLANAYASYVTTFEEFQVQRYEGASTLYGPHTHEAYLQELGDMAAALGDSAKTVDPGPPTPNNLAKMISLVPPVLYDQVPSGSHFGKVVVDVKPSYNISTPVLVAAEFQSANPRNHPRLNGTFLKVEQLQEDGAWVVVRGDANLDTRFVWKRHGLVAEQSTAEIQWYIDPASADVADVKPGKYRLSHGGESKHVFSPIQTFEGHSSTFELTF